MAKKTLNDGEGGLSVRDKLNGMFTELYNWVASFVPSKIQNASNDVSIDTLGNLIEVQMNSDNSVPGMLIREKGGQRVSEVRGTGESIFIDKENGAWRTTIKGNQITLNANAGHRNKISGKPGSHLEFPTKNGDPYFTLVTSDSLKLIMGGLCFFSEGIKLWGQSDYVIRLRGMNGSSFGSYTFGASESRGNTHSAPDTIILARAARGGHIYYPGGNVIIQSGAGNPEGSRSGYTRINANGGNVGVGTDTPDTKLSVEGVITPKSDNTHTLGDSSHRFTDIYATNAVIQTSDFNQKEEIKDLPHGLDFIKLLSPKEFKWKDINKEEITETKEITRQKEITKKVTEEVKEEIIENINGKYVKKIITKNVTKEVKEKVFDEFDLYEENGKIIGKHKIPVMETVTETKIIKPAVNKKYSRKHFGLIAQDILKVLQDENISTNDFAPYIETENGKGLRYVEFISIIIKAIQELSVKIEILENK